MRTKILTHFLKPVYKTNQNIRPLSEVSIPEKDYSLCPYNFAIHGGVTFYPFAFCIELLKMILKQHRTVNDMTVAQTSKKQILTHR